MELDNIAPLLSHLETFKLSDIYLSETFSKYIAPLLVKKNIIATGGAASTIFGIKLPGSGSSWVIKKSSPCEVTTEATDATTSYCNVLNDSTDSVRKIPNPKGQIIEFPNQVMEAIIGGLLRRLAKMSLTYSFVPVYGLWLDPITQSVYTLMPRYSSNITDILKTKADLYLVIFEIAHALSVAQEVFKFTHYDLHNKNIFYEPVSNEEMNSMSFPIVNITVSDYDANHYHLSTLSIKNRGYLIKISDYGLSRLQLEKIQINARTDDYPIKTDGLFNQGYDIAAILHSLLTTHSSIEGNTIAYHITKILKVTKKEKAELYNMVLDLPPSEKITVKNYDEALKKYFRLAWRPQQGKMINYLPVYSMHTIVRKFADKLKSLGLATEYNNTIAIKNNEEPIVILDHLPSYSLLNPWRVESKELLDSISVAPGITIESNEINYNDAIKSWEWTLSDNEKKSLPKKSQIVHIAYINTRKLSLDYQFKLVCCKIDPLDYMRDNFGVAINGGFFDLTNKATMQPIGPFRMRHESNPLISETLSADYFSNLSIPELYKKYYRYINIKGGKISIDSLPYAGADYLMVSGPLLVNDGKLIMTEEEISSVESGINIFQCRKLLEGEEENDVLPHLTEEELIKQKLDSRSDKNSLFNCSNIKPGELSHAGNPNPRSMLVLRDSDKYKEDVLFVYFEGRDDRGMGVDLNFLAKYALEKLGAKIAINLDGGRSSSIVWRSEEESSVIKTANPNHKNFYPVGNILSLVRHS